ncbi:MAG: hypothetical protein ACREPP_10125 [Rhodanobacteraceae bacterium]
MSLQLSDVTRRFSRHVALGGVSLEIPDGNRVCCRAPPSCFLSTRPLPFPTAPGVAGGAKRVPALVARR